MTAYGNNEWPNRRASQRRRNVYEGEVQPDMKLVLQQAEANERKRKVKRLNGV